MEKKSSLSIMLEQGELSESFKLFENEYIKENKDEILCLYDRIAGLVDGARWQKQYDANLQGEKKFASYILGIINDDWHGWSHIVKAIRFACMEKLIEK